MNINLKKCQSTLIILSVLLIPFGAQAGEVTSTFSAGGTLTSTQMNEIKDAVNDNNAGVDANTTAIANFFGGNGSGGDIIIDSTNDDWGTSSEIPPNLNFSNFTILSGVTLSVPAGTTIRCTGTFTNAGTINVLSGARHQTTGFASSGISASSGPMNAIHPGDTLGAPTNGQFDNDAVAIGKTLIGGQGGIGIPEMMARTSFAQFRMGGGAGAGNTSVNSGGGLIKVYCTGSIINTGTINAIGIGGGSTGSGGGGGIVILASQTSVDNSAGTIDVSGGIGGNGVSFSGSSGGGGGGIVMMISPVAPVVGTETVVGGTGGVAGTVTTQSRLAGSGGGASGGNGGNGGGVGSTGVASAGVDGSVGYVITMTDDPGLLAR